MRSYVRGVVLLAAGGFLAGAAAQVWASHQWGCFHWPSRYLTVSDRAKNDYFYAFREEVWTDSDSWNNGTEMVLTFTTSKSGWDVKLVNGDYGFNGWLGITKIWYSGCVITSAKCKLNKTYLSKYSRTARKHAACHEFGHALGLNHTGASDSCLNDRPSSWTPHPNQHDFNKVNEITP